MTPEKQLHDDVRLGLEFSRHYDNLLWIVTSLFVTANAALLASGMKDFHWVTGVAGLLLSVSTVFFAASFRALRLRVHRRLERRYPHQFNWLFSGSLGALNQWGIFVAIFLIFQLLWVYQLAEKFPEHFYGWIFIGAIAFLATMYLHRISERHTDTDDPGA